MPQKTSAQVVLEFCADYPVPMPTKSIYGGLIRTGDITFSYRTVQNKVSELTEKGYLQRVKIDESRGKLIPIDDPNKQGYYVITAEGMERVEELRQHL